MAADKRRLGHRSDALGWLLAAALACSAVAAPSCASSDQLTGEPERATPAGSAARAQARKEREARAKAKGEQKPDKPGPKRKAPPKRPPPRPTAEPVASASSETADAGAPPDAGAAPTASASASAASSSRPPLCAPLCERFVRCMFEKFAGNISSPELLERMRESSEEAREGCVKECEERKSSADESYLDEGYKCMDKPDCSDFVSCVRDLRSR